MKIHYGRISIFIFLISITFSAFQAVSASANEPSNLTYLKRDSAKLKQFTTDGCSWAPDGGLVFNRTKYLPCCVRHDIWYWIGGTSDDRWRADDELYKCIAEKEDHDTAALFFWAVRVAGGPSFNSDFSWGYGWTEPQPYRELTNDENNVRNYSLMEFDVNLALSK